jgi:hypothetical protein
MNIDRLNHLITVMEGVERANKAFNLTDWVFSEELKPGRADNGYLVGSLKESCGTACCALGYAALDPEFTKDGLKLQVEYQESGDEYDQVMDVSTIKEYNALIRDKTKQVFGAVPYFSEFTGYLAGSAFFNITTEAAEYMFGPTSYKQYQEQDMPITPRMVIEHINTVISNKGRAPVEVD